MSGYCELTRQITDLNPTVTLERKDEHRHLHSLETSFMVKVQACAGADKKGDCEKLLGC